MNTRLTRSLLAAAALIGSGTAARAYDTWEWALNHPTNQDSGNIGGGGTLTLTLSDTMLVDCGLYAYANTYAGWDYNGNGFAYNSESYLTGGYGTIYFGRTWGLSYHGSVDLYSDNAYADYGTVYSTEVIPLGTTSVSMYLGLADGGADYYRSIAVFERDFQVARTNDSTGTQGFGVSTAFQSDNDDYSEYYGTNIGGRSYELYSVLPTAHGFLGGPITGSVVRNGDIVLGARGSLEGLYAKDGGWLDIRGDLTVGAYGTVYIRDGEITSDIYTQYNNSGVGHLGAVNFESLLQGEGAGPLFLVGPTLGSSRGGILSVRQHFAQEMYATGDATLGFRDGAFNDHNVYIDGDGYVGGSGASGSLRSITGDNVQNQDVSIGWDGSQTTTIGVDFGSTLTINGRINGANGVASNADKDLVLNVAALVAEPGASGAGLILNGSIRSSVRDVLLVNSGAVSLNAANNMSGSLYALNGVAFIHHANALGAETAYASGGIIALDARNAYPTNLATLGDPDSTASLTIANDIEIGETGIFGLGALTNFSGDNSVTGTVIVGTNGYVGESLATSDGTISVLNGTHLTVSGLDANKSLIGWVLPYTSTLTIETENTTETIDGETVVTRIGTFTNLGDTGAIDKVVKEGDGDAYLGAATASLLTFEVNGGRLFIDSLSTNPSSFGTFRKDGDGTLVIQDTDGVDDAYYGRYNINAGTLATASGAVAHGDVYINPGYVDRDDGSTATLGGKGTFVGNVFQTGGAVAPGFSPGVLTFLGNYTNVGGALNLELAGTAGPGAPTGYDQLRVSGTILVSNALPANYSVIRFVDIDGFEARHGQVFQVIADASGNARNTYDKFDLSETVTVLGDRVLFDHSTGRAYGTGLTTAQNFSHYARTTNQREIGRALWTEAIDYDKSGTSFEMPLAFIYYTYDPVAAAAKDGRKAWILTRHDAVLGELPTDLGAAAVKMLTASSGAAGLDSLSPEPYSGFAELATRLNRTFAQLGATSRRSGDDNKWGFDVGYSGEQLTSDSSSDYTSFKTSSDTAYLLADLALGTKVHLNLSAGLDDGRVLARGFSGDTNSAIFGLGIGITPESKFARFDLGASYSITDFDAVRQGSYMSQDGQNAYAFSARVTFLPKDPPVNAVAQAKAGPPSNLSLSPYLGVVYASTDVDGFSEADVPGSAQLNVGGFKRRSLIGELGLDLEYAVGASTTLTGVLAYEHEFHDRGRTDMVAEFADTGVDDTFFRIRTDGFGTNLFRVGVGIRQQLGAKASFGLGYDALFGGGVDSGQHVKADLSFRF